MSMTKSRQKVFWERREARERANRRPPNPCPICAEIRRQVTLLWASGCPGTIWLGRQAYAQWLEEMCAMTDGSTFILMEFEGVRVRRKGCPGIAVTGLDATWDGRGWVFFDPELDLEIRRHGGRDVRRVYRGPSEQGTATDWWR